MHELPIGRFNKWRGHEPLLFYQTTSRGDHRLVLNLSGLQCHRQRLLTKQFQVESFGICKVVAFELLGVVRDAACTH